MSKKYIKWDIKKARKLFKDNGCELLEEVYINAKTKMRYICSCEFKTEAEITLDHFKRGRRCKKCGIERQAESQRYTFKEVKKYFEDNDCELLEKVYIDSSTKMKFRCDCGEVGKITFNKLQQGGRCIECGGTKKLTFEFVKKYFEDRSCKLLETEYINYQTPMRYQCDCGNSDCKISFGNFKSGQKCMECSGNKKYTFEEVKKYFENHDCELKETEYINNLTLMNFRCSCENLAKISFAHFREGVRCKKCGIKKQSGKNNWRYNPNLTDEEREKRRSYPGYKKWRQNVCGRDNFICQICGEIEGKMCAHHLESYDNNEELRLVVSNGITLCEEHHIEFHKMYGYGNNTTEQYNEFIKIGVV